jgi:hypothetical protein
MNFIPCITALKRKNIYLDIAAGIAVLVDMDMFNAGALLLSFCSYAASARIEITEMSEGRLF